MEATHTEYRVEFQMKFGAKVQHVEVAKGTNMLMRAIRLAANATGVAGRKWVDVTIGGRTVFAGVTNL